MNRLNEPLNTRIKKDAHVLSLSLPFLTNSDGLDFMLIGCRLRHRKFLTVQLETSLSLEVKRARKRRHDASELIKGALSIR